MGAPPPIALAKGYKRGTHRLVAPEVTLQRARRLMPLMGITRVANVTGLDCIGIPVVTVSRPNSRSVSVAQGKGLTLAAAKASGLMESIESFHAEHALTPLVRASHNELRFGRRVVDIAALPRSSASSFHGDLPIFWVEGLDLVGGVSAWVPFDLVHTNYTLPLLTHSGSFLMNSNGLASGNHLAEAIGHGICEVIERDATTLWHCSSEATKTASRVDLATVADPDCQDLLEKYDRAGLAVAAWDMSSDIGVASFLCAIAERSPSPLRPLPAMHGMGCHPAREVALARALTEAAQGRMTMITGSRDDLRRTTYAELRDLEYLRRMQERMSSPGRLRRFDDVPTWTGAGLDDDLGWLLGRLRTAGIEQVIAVDLTRPEFGIPVVRVIIPGLEGIHDVPGYTPGRRARARLMAEGAR